MLRLMPYLEEALSESDRVYRGQLNRWSESLDFPPGIDGLGLFKARFISGLFVWYAFADKWIQKNEMIVTTFADAVSGGALHPFVHDDKYPPIDRSQAKAVVSPLITVCFDAIGNELSSPKTGLPNSKGFRRLVELQYLVLSESIKVPIPEFPAALEMPIRSTILSYLNLCVRCIGLLR
jgi:hypothetical protein